MSLTQPALSVFFRVSVDAEFDLGYWNSITGIGVKLEVTKRNDTAVTILQHHQKKHIDYGHITLKRQCTTNSAAIINWINAYHLLPIPTSAEISAICQDGTPIATWQMIGVSPVEWQGPTFDASAALTVPTESLKIAHMGFL
jgi:phage tail-like protein